MRNILCVCLVGLLVSVAYGLPQNRYTSKYDNVDVDRILSNDRILTSYIKCLQDKGACTAEGRELKATLPDALENNCSKCNEKQKQLSEKVIKHLQTHRPKDWNDLLNKYDPQGKFRSRYNVKKH